MKHLTLTILLTVSTINAAVRVQDDWVDPHDMNTNVKEKYLPKLKKSESSPSVDDNNWVDPHDMNTNVKEKYVPKLKKSDSSVADNIIDPIPDIWKSHFKRVVSLLMNSAHVDKRDLDLYYGLIRFNIHPSDYEFLINFARNDLTLDNLRKLDTVLNNSFRRSYIDGYLDTIESLQLKLYNIVMNLQNLWLLGALFILYFVYQLFKNNFSLVYIFKYLFVMVLILDYGYRYHLLVEEADQHNLGVVYSPHCDTSQMSWAEYSKFVFKFTDCEKKTVTPLDPFLFQLKIFMQAFGTGLGGFGGNMFTSLPWGLNLIIWPIMLIFTLILILFGMTIFTEQSIEFNIFHLVKFKFGGGTQTERSADRLLHRPMVENVLLDGPSRGNRKSGPKKQASLKRSSSSKEVDKKTPNSEPKTRTEKTKVKKQQKEGENVESPNNTFLEELSKILSTEDISTSSEADNSAKSTDSKKAETLK